MRHGTSDRSWRRCQLAAALSSLPVLEREQVLGNLGNSLRLPPGWGQRQWAVGNGGKEADTWELSTIMEADRLDRTSDLTRIQLSNRHHRPTTPLPPNVPSIATHSSGRTSLDDPRQHNNELFRSSVIRMIWIASLEWSNLSNAARKAVRLKGLKRVIKPGKSL